MAATYNLISSNVLATSAASVTFSSIPQTYTDLVLKWSTRTSNSATTDYIYVKFDSSSAVYSYRGLRGNGSTAISINDASDTYFAYFYASDGATATSNTFSNGEMYIPSYTSNAYKQTSTFFAQEDNASTAYIVSSANLYSNTSAVSTITLTSANANFVTNSSFYLYGIKNS